MIKWSAKLDFHKNVVTASTSFRETAKMFVMEDIIALTEEETSTFGYISKFSKDDNRLHDTREEAIQHLIDVEEKIIASHQENILRSRTKISLFREALNG